MSEQDGEAHDEYAKEKLALSDAVIVCAEELLTAAAQENDSDRASQIRDRAELMRALARFCRWPATDALSIHHAFGSPGDWGYSTQIGSALQAVYDHYNQKILMSGGQG